jgi:ABC-type dipeptide/oligopeptide/nickel transport system permease component
VQRFIAVRVLQSLLALWVMSLIVFGLARLSGDPLDVMLPIEAMREDYERLQQGRSSWTCLAGAMSELNYRPDILDWVETWTFNAPKCMAVFKAA